MFIPLSIARPKIFAKQGNDPRPVKQTKLRPRDVERAIQHAQLICFGHEDTPACRVAWDKVEELSSALAHQREADLVAKALEEMCIEDPASCKEFDL